jgi:hypothetical protein
MNDELFRKAKQVAAAEGITLKELIENGVRNEHAQRQRGSYTLADVSFDGRGVHPGITEGDWDTIRELIYSGRGG